MSPPPPPPPAATKSNWITYVSSLVTVVVAAAGAYKVYGSYQAEEEQTKRQMARQENISKGLDFFHKRQEIKETRRAERKEIVTKVIDGAGKAVGKTAAVAGQAAHKTAAVAMTAKEKLSASTAEFVETQTPTATLIKEKTTAAAAAYMQAARETLNGKTRSTPSDGKDD
jgi:hypothetical protein